MFTSLLKKLRGASGARLDILDTLPKGAVGAEIGVHLGDYSEQILKVTQPSKLYLIDPWKYESDEEYKTSWYGGEENRETELEERYQSVLGRFSSRIASKQVEVLRASSEDALESLTDDSLDFVYIDGNHLYEFAKMDLELSLKKVKSGGYITGDDYTPGKWWKGGVKKAVDEFGWNDGVKLLWINGKQFVFQVK